MSWFGDTFGDSLSSLKGQITKITKEVLAEDDNENEKSGDIQLRLKELDALCSSKDLEIHSLREENRKISEKFLDELELLRDENEKLKADLTNGKEGNLLLSDDQIRQVCQLENELQQIKIERDHLEELQKDHQSNICLVVKQRDNYKQQFEKIKENYSALQLEYDKLIKSQNYQSNTDNLSDVNLVENQIRNDELVNLRNSVEKLQFQIETYQNEKKETSKVIERQKLNSENLTDKINNLTKEIENLNSERDSYDLENKKLSDKLNVITSDLKDEQEKRFEIEEKLKNLIQTQDKIRIEELNFKTELDGQVNNLLKIFFPNHVEKYSNMSLSELIIDIENLWKTNLVEKENKDKVAAYDENVNKFQVEIERLKKEKSNLESNINLEIDKRNELESNYKKEINLLQNKLMKLKSEEQDCIIKSQTDDVKRLNQEVLKLMEAVEIKNNELSECYNKINSNTLELNKIKNISNNMEQELIKIVSEKEKLENDFKNYSESKEEEIKENERKHLEKYEKLEGLNNSLLGNINDLQHKLNVTVKYNKDLEDSLQSNKKLTDMVENLKKELDSTIESKLELDKVCADLQQLKLNNDKQSEYLKAQLIVKETNISEINAKNKYLMQDIDELKEKNLKLQGVEEELSKWKEAMVELEIQRQDLSDQKNLLAEEYASLKEENRKEIERLQSENKNLRDACDKLKNDVENKVENTEVMPDNFNEVISGFQTEIDNLKSIGQQQANTIMTLTQENNELKSHLQHASEELDRTKLEGPQNHGIKEKAVQHHKRSKSDFDTNSGEMDPTALRMEINNLKEASQKQQNDYKALQEQYAMTSEKEAHLKRDLERLRLHLIEIENYYTETIDEYKTKLSTTEERLKNSSSFYTSNKVRDNQHLESLQSQIRLISTQRDALQEKLSAAEDEVQKHKAALTSFHVVLEQFQQDKERECECIAAKYQNQLLISDKKLSELQEEIETLNHQINDAKNGLKAASRLGEQLEKKSEYINELESRLAKMQTEAKELEETAKVVNQSNFDRVDKSLVKNLVLGYLLAQKADRKQQVLRIMMSVLDFDDDERNRIGMDHSQSGWLSNLLHPKSDGTSSSQSLSEAFIRFLENESRPQPQLKLLPERTLQVDSSRSGSNTPKPSLLLQELVLPTFNSPRTNESTILKDVLYDS